MRGCLYLAVALQAMLIVPGSAAELTVEWHDGQGLTINAKSLDATLTVESPFSVQILDASKRTTWHRSDYDETTAAGDVLSCRGRLRTTNGSLLEVTDMYTVVRGTPSLLVSRDVRVLEAAGADVGFATQFAVKESASAQLVDQELFLPGHVYRDNHNVPPLAIGADFDHDTILVREDRLPLPCVAIRNPETRVAISLTHVKPDGGSVLGDRGLGPVVDDRMLFGSIGIRRTKQPSLAFVFPGCEGERTYVSGRSEAPRWAMRCHPLRQGAAQHYELLVALRRSGSFGDTVARVWREAYERFRPRPPRIDQHDVYQAGIDVLRKYWSDYDGVPGFPFSVNLPDGSVKNVSLQMGFVGQQIPAAVHLVRYGLANNRSEVEQRGGSIIDFWTRYSASEQGVLRTWHDVRPSRWRKYGTFLRIACDGATGVLRGWNVMHQRGKSRPAWLAFCEAWGDWLVAHQNPDGSFYRQYDFSGAPMQTTRSSTTHPIRFLVDLSSATGKDSYRDAAIRAGNHCLKTVHEDYTYVGGTPDNHDVVDKEAGMIACDAFLALYDATHEMRWLRAAEQAATFTETWTYCWNVPMVGEDAACTFPKGKSTVGMSLIATGHSGADSGMASMPFAYLRLYLYTGDRHYRDVADTLLHSTRQLQDLEGRLGYPSRGLQTEAMRLAVERGHSVNVWLPWLTVATLDPLSDLQEVFGAMDIEEIENLGIHEMKRRNAEYGKTRGFKAGSGPSVGR